MTNIQICYHCHQSYNDNADKRCNLCGWVNNDKNNALLDKINSYPHLVKQVEKIKAVVQRK